QRSDGLATAGDGKRAEAGGRAAEERLEAGVLVRELQRLDEVRLVGLAVDAQQADRGRDGRLRRARCASLERGECFERAPVADLAERNGRVHLQRTVELRDAGDRVVRILRLVVAERLDDGAPEIIEAPSDFLDEYRPHALV